LKLIDQIVSTLQGSAYTAWMTGTLGLMAAAAYIGERFRPYDALQGVLQDFFRGD